MRDYAHFLATDQDITTEAVSENVINLGAASKSLGNSGRGLVVHLLVKTAFAGLDSGIHINVTTSAAAALTSDVGVAAFGSAACSDDMVIPATDLTAGTHLMCAIPPGVALLQYLGLNFVPVSEAASAGAVDAWVGFADEAGIEAA